MAVENKTEMDESFLFPLEKFFRNRDGIILMLIILVLLISIVFLVILQIRHQTRPTCSAQLRTLAKSMLIYANDAGGVYPPTDKWCDLLTSYQYVTCEDFLCDRSDAVLGESSYAMNKNIDDANGAQLPGDMVLLFDTNLGRESGKRKWTIGQRQWYQFIKASGSKMPRKYRRKKVYKNRWNQTGGPEIVSTENHNGDGCNVVFVDTHVRFYSVEDLPKLRWTVNDANQ